MPTQPVHYDFVSELLRSLRGEILSGFGQAEHTLKDDLTAVTTIDVQVERKIRGALLEQFPDIGYYGEEEGRHGSSETYWLVDPIDGTENYLRGLPGFMSVVGLVESGVCSQSYIYDPILDIIYSAFRGGGAYANGQPLSVSARPMQRAIIAMGSKLSAREPQLYADLYSVGMYHLTQFFGSACKAVYLASGKIEGIILHNQGGGPWDLVPTRLLAQEAGAIVTYFDGEETDSRSYALLTPAINEPIIARLRELWG